MTSGSYGFTGTKIKVPISYIIDCSSEFHHMPLDTGRDENAFITSIRFF